MSLLAFFEDEVVEPPEEERLNHARLTWRLLEWKLAYYYPETIKPELLDKYTVHDALYDEAEIEYLTYCKKYNQPNYSVHKGYPGFEDVENFANMGIDFDRGSVRLVLSKIGI